MVLYWRCRAGCVAGEQWGGGGVWSLLWAQLYTYDTDMGWSFCFFFSFICSFLHTIVKTIIYYGAHLGVSMAGGPHIKRIIIISLT